jgi:hypothetical protein
MAYKGKYTPKHPEKYIGDVKKIIYRSLWERKFMVYCDTNVNVLEWGSEELAIPYISPVDNRHHRYYPDFWIKVRNKNNRTEVILIEVKPKKQLTPPDIKNKYNTPSGRVSTRFIKEVKTYAVNQAKWEAAKEFCDDRKWKFQILTEKELQV